MKKLTIGVDNLKVFSVTPENEFCLQCKKKKCNGNCEERKAYMREKRKQMGLGKKGGSVKGRRSPKNI